MTKIQAAADISPSELSDLRERAVLRKAAWRLIPFLGLLYFMAFLDRVNIGFAALTMNADLSFSATIFGMGAGIFFVGYVLFEVPSNLMLHRVGARRWIARIMITWGLLSTFMAFIHSPWSFYVLRFLLGIAEAGFFPGIILYLTYWFPAQHRGRILGAFMVALPLASVIGAPLSTALLDLSGWGLRGWQWLFILEGVPAVLIGFAVLKVLTDRPEEATWLAPDEKACLVNLLAAERRAQGHHPMRAAQGMSDVRVWLFGVMYFALLVSLYGFNFWLPQIIQSSGPLTHTQVGVLTMLPNLVAAAVMYQWARHSDATGERHWHVALPAFLAAIGFVLSAVFVTQPSTATIVLCLAAVGLYAVLPVFWTLPTKMLRGAAAASGIALINSIGNLGGYAGSALMGYLKDATGGHQYGLYVLAVSMMLGGVLALLLARRDDPR